MSELEEETLEYREKRAEEVLTAYRSIFVDCSENYKAKRGFIEGTNWQAERMYSGQDLIDFVHFINDRHFNKFTINIDEVDLFIEQRNNK